MATIETDTALNWATSRAQTAAYSGSEAQRRGQRVPTFGERIMERAMSRVTTPPVPVVRMVEYLRDRLYRLHQRLAPAPTVMMDLILAGWMSQAIEAAAELGVADALAGGPLPVDDLARKVGADPQALDRLLRALVGRGVFRRLADRRYALNPVADTLRTDAPVSMKGAALFYGSPQHREHWTMLANSVRSGRASIPVLRGKPFFDYLSEDAELARLFNEAMTSVSGMAEQAIVAAYEFGECGTIVDVGGGHGRLLAAILDSAPTARGLLFDLPDVVTGAPALMRERNVAQRVRIETGSFFDGVPGGGDVYVLKLVIHDWPDARAVEILRNVRGACDGDSTLLLAELVLPEHDRDFVGNWADLEMLLGADSHERTAEQYKALLEQAGFRMTRVIPTVSPFSLVEAKPA